MRIPYSLCVVCDMPADEDHHLIYGNGRKPIADFDSITIPICRTHHAQIHNTGSAGYLSKALGQALWMLDNRKEGESVEDIKERFRRRYGKSWL